MLEGEDVRTVPRKTSNRAVKAKVIALLVQGMSIKDAAAECGVPKNTVYEWKELDPAFQEMLAEAEDRAVEVFLEEGTRQARNQIADCSLRIAEVLRESLYHTDPKVRLQAAGMGLRFLNLDKDLRTMEFERALSTTDDNPAHFD
jgi:AcrR family transcriptional regulator